MRIVASIMLLALGGSAGGCAFLVASPPREAVALPDPPACNPGKGAVVVDALMATMLGFAALGLVSGEEEGAGAVVGLLGAAYGGSAYYGSVSADKCRGANQEFNALVVEQNRGLEVRAARAEAAAQEAEARAAAAARPAGKPGAAAAAAKPAPAAVKPVTAAPVAAAPAPVAARPVALPTPAAAAAAAEARAAAANAGAAPSAIADPYEDGDEDDGGGGDEEAEATDDDDDAAPPAGPGRWRAFWREVTP